MLQPLPISMTFSVNECMCSAVRVKDYLEQFGLASNIPEQLSTGACVLGLHVREKKRKMRWCHGCELLAVPNRFTCLIVFSVCGKWTGHFPVTCRHGICEVKCKHCDNWME